VSRSLPGRSRANPYPRRAHTPPTVGRGLPPTASSRGRVPTWSAKAAETHAVSERRPPQKSQGASPPPRRAARVLPRHRLGVPTVCLGRSGQGSRNPPETRQVAPLRGIPAPGYATETRATFEAPEGCSRVAYLREIETGRNGVIGASDPKNRGPRFFPRAEEDPDAVSVFFLLRVETSAASKGLRTCLRCPPCVLDSRAATA
jgi:hypothetical protein